MLFSGADLIRNSGQLAERLERMRAAEPLRKVESSGQSQSDLQDETQNALLRFARFIKKESGKEKERSPGRDRPPALRAKQAQRYVRQAGLARETPVSGSMLDIYT